MTLFRARIVNGALLACALGLSAAVVLTNERVTTSEKLSREGNVLGVYRPEQISSLEITRLGKPDGAEGPRELRLVRDPASKDTSEFFIGSPGGTRADPASVSELLAALEFSAWLRRIEPSAVNRAAFGLDAPKLELRLAMGGVSYRLVVGGPAPTPQGAYYAELSGSDVLDPGVGIISGELAERLDQNFHGFVGKLLLPYAKSDLKELRLSGTGGERRIVKDAVGFRLGDGKGPRLDDAAVDRLLFQMARVSAERFADPAAAKRALERGPRVRIEQIPTSGPTVVVEVGGTCPTQGGGEPLVTALRTSAPVLGGCVPATVMPSLVATAGELAARTPFTLRADEVDHVTIVEKTESGPRRLEAIRSGAAFELLEPAKEKLDLDAGNDLVKGLTSPVGELRTDSEPPLAELGLAPPRGTVTLRGLREGEKEPVDQVVTFSAPDALGRVWLRREDDGAVLALSTASAWAFSTDDTWARPRELVPVDKDAIERIEVERNGVKQVLEQSGETAKLLEPPGFEVDGPLASDWLASVAHLHAVRWLRAGELEGEKKSTSLQKDGGPLHVRITYRTKEGVRTASFTANERTVGGFRSRWEGAEPGWFVLPTEVERALATLPISRFALTLDVDHVERLTLEGPTASHALERRAGELTSVDGSLSRDAVVQLEQLLASLRPESALHVGPPREAEGFDEPELVIVGTTKELGREEKPFRIRFGRVGTHELRTIQYARADGVDATFIIERASVERILDLL
jgi:hypothetical protein